MEALIESTPPQLRGRPDPNMVATMNFLNNSAQKLKNDNISLGRFVPAAAVQQYSQSMDAAKVDRLEKEGSQRLADFMKHNDETGAVDFVKNCAATYQSLGQ